MPVKDLDEVASLAQKANVLLVRFLYVDLSSVIRGKTTRLDKFRERLESGIGLVKGMMAMNLLDQLQTDTGLGATGEVRLLPDPETLVILPYAERSAAVICDLKELDHSSWSVCPRSLLKRQIEQARTMGTSFQVAFEPEFMLGTMQDGLYAPIDKSLCFSTDGMNRAGRFINKFIEALEKQGLEVEQYYPELGAGQHELSIRHAPALAACDRHIYYRETLRGLATEFGYEAYLAPKPFDNMPGNGCHLHLSAWDAYGERNMFWSEKGLSEFGRHFVAGVLAHLPALVAITCPSVNSYRRLRPRSWSSAYVCWGYENREAAVRVPSVYWGQEMATTNIEIKCVDSTCNPYLALACLIASGMDGVSRKLEPPQPIDFDPGAISDADLQDHNIERLPISLHEALIELEQDKLLMNVLGPELAQTFITVKSSECGAFAAANADFELSQHRSRF